MVTAKRIVLILVMLVVMPSAAFAGAIGSEAHGFTLNDGAGREVSLSDFRGRVVFLNFWASWCGPCKKEFPELASFIAGYDASEAVVIAVNIDKHHSHAMDFLKENASVPENMVVLFDPRATVVSEYRAAAMPTSFVIDKSGKIRYIHFGFDEDNPKEWAAEVGGLINTEPPEQKQ